MKVDKNSAFYDDAWSVKFDQKPSNYALKKGMQVELVAQTLGQFGVVIPAKTRGMLVDPKIPRRRRGPGVSSLYIAQVKATFDGIEHTLMVPHGALRIVKTKAIA